MTMEDVTIGIGHPLKALQLSTAFKGWSMLKQNYRLAANSRDAVQKVLLRTHGTVALCDIDAQTARTIVRSNDELQDVRVKAASILVHLLEYYSAKGYCSKPKFDYTIAMDDEVSPAQDNQACKKEAKVKKAKVRKHPVQKRRILQVDTKTGLTVATFGSVSEATSKTGIHNIYRCLKSDRTAGGYAWREMDAAAVENLLKSATFEMKEDEKDQPQQHCVEQPSEETANKALPICAYSDLELVDEIRRRGWKGTVRFTYSIEL